MLTHAKTFFSPYAKAIRFGATAGLFISLLVLTGVWLSSGKQPAQAAGERDCEPTSVIWCGALTVDELIGSYQSGGPADHRYNDIAAIYNSFGISEADVMSLKTKVKMGQVKADGNVFVDGVQIGTGAMTAGRVKTTKSVAIAGTGAFKRPPSDSFRTPTTTLDAYIGLDENGQPAWAILASCGNPVTWEMPKVSVEKKVQNPGNGQFVKDTDLTNGTNATYQVTVTNSGTSAEANVKLADDLPDHQTYVASSTKKDGQAVADSASGITRSGMAIGTLAAGQKVVVTYQARVKVPDANCGPSNMVNKVTMTSDHNPGAQSSATTRVNVQCVTARCVSLTTTATNLEVGKQATFTASADAQNTTVSTYVFQVNGQQVQATNSNSFVYTANQAGTVTVSVMVKFADGTVAGGGACTKTITVSQKPVTAKYSCDQLDPPVPVTGQTRTYSFTAHITAEGGATFKQATWTFGDEQSPQDKLVNTSLTAQHTYAPGTYNASVSITFMVDGVEKVVNDSRCATSVQVPGEVLPAETLTKTGPGAAGMIGLFIGSSSLAGFGYYQFANRRRYES